MAEREQKLENAGKISGVRKAATILVLLGDEISSLIFRHLNEDEIEVLSREISQMDQVKPENAKGVLDEFYNLFNAQEYLNRGGVEYAKRLLVKALGPDEAQRLLDRVVRLLKASPASFDMLQKADPQQLSRFIQNEHPQTIALILAHLNTSQAAAVLRSFPMELQSEVVMRMANLEHISPEIIGKITSVLDEKLKALGDYSRQSYGGARAVAELLNRMDSSLSRKILERIEASNPELAISIRDLMFVFDDILIIDDMGMREILQHVDKKTLALALKGTSEELKARFFSNMSQRAAEILREDMEAMGAVKLREVERAQQEIMAVIRQLEQSGVISFSSTGTEQYVT